MPDLIPTSRPPGGEFLLYQSEDGRTRLEVRLEQETVWLSLNQMADLFQRDKSVTSRHISNVFDERELRPAATVAEFATAQIEGGKRVARERVVANFATTAADGKTYQVEFFNLDVTKYDQV